MFWRNDKQQEINKSAAPSLTKREIEAPDAEASLAKALSAYEREYYDRVRNSIDLDAEKAKKIVESARNFISESRLGYSLTRPVLEHVRPRLPR